MEKIIHKQQVPVGIKIISIIYYVGGILGIINGVLKIFSGLLLLSVKEYLGTSFSLFSFIFFGIIMIGGGILTLFIARGLWKAKRWARIVTIISVCLGIIASVIMLTQGKNIVVYILGIILNFAIVGYLLFNNNVKKAFRK